MVDLSSKIDQSLDTSIAKDFEQLNMILVNWIIDTNYKPKRPTDQIRTQILLSGNIAQYVFDFDRNIFVLLSLESEQAKYF